VGASLEVIQKREQRRPKSVWLPARLPSGKRSSLPAHPSLWPSNKLHTRAPALAGAQGVAGTVHFQK